MKSNIWRGSATDGVYVPVYRGALTTELTVRYGETEYRMQAAMEDGEAPLYYAYLPGRGEVTLRRTARRFAPNRRISRTSRNDRNAM